MALVLGPFAFTNAQKTALLQVMTSLLRWMSFLMMIIIAAIGIHSGKVGGGEGKEGERKERREREKERREREKEERKEREERGGKRVIKEFIEQKGREGLGNESDN